jgi:hypothetical protein
MSDIKVSTSVQRRRRWPPEEKREMVEEAPIHEQNQIQFPGQCLPFLVSKSVTILS